MVKIGVHLPKLSQN